MIRASQIFFWFGMTLAASIALYHTSDRSYDLNRQLRTINNAIEAEQQKIHVLNTEWVYLANPARVETFVKKHITDLRSTATRQVIDLASLDEALPLLTEAQKMVAAMRPAPAADPTPVAAAPAPAEAKIAEAQPKEETKPASENEQEQAAPVPPPKPTLRKVAVAAPRVTELATSHVNERMVMQRVAKTETQDKIGALIAELGTQR